MSHQDWCPKCGAEVFADGLSGLCPKCLLAVGLESAGDREGAAGPNSAGFSPPEPVTLAAYFPQLEIIELVGYGGMGAVYKARQPQLDRIVALKIIRPESADTLAFAERFNREARLLARLNHPHIVSLYDFGEVVATDAEASGHPRSLYFFLMEYVDGVNLRELMRAGELTSKQVLAIVPQVCEALQFAHDEGIVHRDIKPENVMLDKRGRVKIADFGLAKLIGQDLSEFALTATHQLMGTPRYMAPEQLDGAPGVDHRADIYSLGVVFYELLTGEVPAGHFQPPSKKVQVDERLDDVVLRALAREPDRRYQHASDVKTDVESISQNRELTGAADESSSGRTRNAGRSRRLAMTVVSLAVLASVTLLWSTLGSVFATQPDDAASRKEAQDLSTKVLSPLDKAKNEKSGGTPSSKQYALSFDGVDDFVEVADLKYDGSHPITIELRVKSASPKDFQQLVLVSNFDMSGDQDYGICLFQRGDAYPKPKYVSWAMSFAAKNNQSQSLIASAKDWKKDRESHIAFVAAGRRFQFYIDGKLWRHGELADAQAPSKQPFSIGGHPTLNGYFQGTMDEIRVSKIARYAKKFTPAKRFEPDKDTMALYHCDEASGNTLTDSSGNNRNGKIHGATWALVE